MLCRMRTTVNLPDDLLRQAKGRAVEEGTTLTALLADGLRLRLSSTLPVGDLPPLPVSTRGGGLRPGIDPASTASLLDAADGPDAAA